MCQIPFQVLSEVSHFILPACLVGSDFFYPILQMRKLMIDSFPSVTQLTRWKSEFDPRSGSKAYAFLKCLEVLLKAITRALNRVYCPSRFSLFFCSRLSGLITPLVRIRMHWAPNFVWSLDGPSEFFTKQNWQLYGIIIGLPLWQKCERWAKSVSDSMPASPEKQLSGTCPVALTWAEDPKGIKVMCPW